MDTEYTEENETDASEYSQTEVVIEDTEADNDFIQSPLSPSVIQTTKVPQELVKMSKYTRNEKEPPKKNTKYSNIDRVTAAVNTLKKISEKSDSSKSDEFDTFGKIVAAHLRHLDMEAALESQADILNYLVRKRLGRKASLASLPSTLPEGQYSTFPPHPAPDDSSTSASSYGHAFLDNRDQSPQHYNTTSESTTADILRTAWENVT